MVEYVALSKVDANRRLKEREAFLWTLNPLPDGRTKVEITEQSLAGLTVKTSTPIAPGTTVQIRSKDSLMLGDVRHCTGLDESFHLGIRVDDSFSLELLHDYGN